MKTIDEQDIANTRSPHSDRHESNVQAGDEDPFQAAIGQLRAEAEATLTSVRRAIYVERQALGLSLFDAGVRLWAYATVGVVGVLVAATAALLWIAGLRQALQDWSHGAWWGDCILAAVLCALLPLLAYSFRRSVHRSALARTRLELQVTQDDHVSSSDGSAKRSMSA